MAELTREQVEEIAQKAADKAIEGYLLKMGLDVKDPLEMQSDMLFIRKFKNTCNAIGGKVVMVIVATLTVFALGGIGVAIKNWLSK